MWVESGVTGERVFAGREDFFRKCIAEEVRTRKA